MVKVIWQKRASRVLDERLAYASAEFGKSTAKRWLKEIAYAEARIASIPMSYTPEPLLAGKRRVYLYCHLMNFPFFALPQKNSPNRLAVRIFVRNLCFGSTMRS